MCRGDAQEKLQLLYRLHLPPALPLLLDEDDVEIGVEADQFFDGTTVPTSMCHIRVNLSFFFYLRVILKDVSCYFNSVISLQKYKRFYLCCFCRSSPQTRAKMLC